jgi:hypothetical protein
LGVLPHTTGNVGGRRLAVSTSACSDYSDRPFVTVATMRSIMVVKMPVVFVPGDLLMTCVRAVQKIFWLNG